MKKLFAVLLTLTMLCSMGGALADMLKVGTEASFPPYEFYDGETIVGIDAEIADAIAKKLGYEGAEIKDMAFDSIIPNVISHDVDIAMAGFTASAERMSSVYFSFPYATGVQVVIVKEDSPITSVDDLFAEGANHIVGVQLGTTGDIYATGDIEEAGLGKVSGFTSGVDAVEALKVGKVDCVIIDSEPAKAYVAANEGLKILETAYTEEDYAIVCAQDEAGVEMLGKVTAALQDLICDGTVQGIIDKYITAE